MSAATIQTVEVEAVTNTSAILRGYMWTCPDGGWINFRYKKSGGSWSYTPYQQAIDAPKYYAHRVSGLVVNSLYYFEIEAEEGGDWNYGGQKSFKTRATAPDGVPGHIWVEGNYLCYLDSAGYKRMIVAGEG